jgi:hypothetical protein
VDGQTNTVELWRVRAEQLPTQLMGVDLTKDQQLQLASGHAVRLGGLLDGQGEPFNATVRISPAKQELQFTDINRLDVAFKPDNTHRQQVQQNNEGAKTDQAQSLEAAIGARTISHNQLETVQKLLGSQPDQKQTGPKHHVH